MARPILEFGPYRLHTRPDRLLMGAQTVALRPRSLSVLAYLARHPGRVVTKDELRRHVWGAAHVSDTAPLEAVAGQGHLIAHRGVAEWPDSTLSERYRFRHALYREGLYAAIPEARRSGLHRRVGERLRAAWGDRATALAPVLAIHFEQGREREGAARFRRLAGERALGRHAYHEAVEHLHRALDALGQTPRHEVESEADASRRIRRELRLRTLLAPALIATRGYTDAEVERTHLRAQELAQGLAEPARQIPVLFNLWTFHLVRGEHRPSRDLAARMAELTAGVEDGELYLMAQSARAQSAYFVGELAASAAAARDVVARYDPELHGDLALRYAHDDPGVVCLCHLALLGWLRGDPDRALERERQALELAASLDHPYSEAMALAYTTMARQLRRDVETVDRQAGTLAALAAEHGFEHWAALSRFFRGWATAAQGDGQGIERMEQGLETWRGMGAGLCVPYFLGVLAETELAAGRPEAAAGRVAEAQALVERHDERWWQAELHRLEGEVLRLAGEGGERAEACFRRALALARRQQAASLEERSALSLSRLTS